MTFCSLIRNHSLGNTLAAANTLTCIKVQCVVAVRQKHEVKNLKRTGGLLQCYLLPECDALRSLPVVDAGSNINPGVTEISE